METEYGNPSSLHRMGYRAEQMVNRAAEQLAAALFCEPKEILFTSGATEANNLALFGCAEANRRRGNTIITTAIEHPSVLEPAAVLEKQGFRVKYLKPDAGGSYTPQQFAEAVDEDTILVSCMFVNNETGLIQPVEEIAAACKRRNPQVVVHSDAVQGFLRQPLRVKSSQLDLVSVSGHKVQAPKGIGALYVRRGVRLLPRVFGGGQQGGVRSGTEPVPLIAAFGAAAEAQREQVRAGQARYEALKAQLCAACRDIPGVTVHSTSLCAPHIVSLSVQGIRSEILLHYLEEFEIYVSSGSACAKGKHSHVLEAVGVERRAADETIRVSFGADTTGEMVEQLVSRLAEANRCLAKQR